jgi:putative flippase GtrA
VKTLALRWLRFNFVGGLGVGIQLGSLAILKDIFHVQYLAATALAVELAVLHNFVWHVRFTWKDRPGSIPVTLQRLLRFHLGNGLISIAGNLVLMRVLAGGLGLHYLVANAISIAICSFANFAAGEWFVFRGEEPRASDAFSKSAGIDESY